MRDVHGAVMAGNVIAFVAGLIGVFVMQSALQGDRRLVIAGFRPGEAISARLIVMAAATGLVVAVSAIVTALSFSVASWAPFVASLVLIGLLYAAIGALGRGGPRRLAATYLILFLAHDRPRHRPEPDVRHPHGGAVLLPGYGPGRVMVDGAFSSPSCRRRSAAFARLARPPGRRGLRRPAPRGRSEAPDQRLEHFGTIEGQPITGRFLRNVADAVDAVSPRPETAYRRRP